MNKIAYTGIVVFVTVILTLVAVHFLSKAPDPLASRPAALPESFSNPGVGADRDKPGNRTITLEELANHNQPGDCWMAIHGKVYDFTSYIPMHPTPPGVLKEWCGKDASEGWDTKGIGRSHSRIAQGRLAQYEIGILGE